MQLGKAVLAAGPEYRCVESLVLNKHQQIFHSGVRADSLPEHTGRCDHPFFENAAMLEGKSQLSRAS